MRLAWRFSSSALAACVLWGAGALLLGRSAPAAETPREVIPVAIETANRTVTIQAEVACSRAERALGLMGRETLGPDAGMIFLVPKPRLIRMWMAETPLSLDFVFFDSSGHISKIEKEAEPMSESMIDSGGSAAGVLELRGGRVDELEIELKDKILYDYPQWRCED
ncbi:MAG: DUF192 domain-containing protein [Alphaproteobacteria bacterium]